MAGMHNSQTILSIQNRHLIDLLHFGFLHCFRTNFCPVSFSISDDSAVDIFVMVTVSVSSK